MSRRRKRFWWGAGALTLGLGLALWIVPSWSRSPRRVVLPDGSTLTLKSVSFGTNHYAPPAFRNFLLRQVPSGLAAKLRLDRPQLLVTPTPHLTTWWEWRNRVTDREPLIFMVDDAGALGPAGGILPVSGDRAMYAVIWKSFPRRAETLRLRVYQTSATRDPKPFAELRLGNPIRRSFAQWSPEPLPNSRRLDDLEFSLVGFQIEMTRGLPGFDWCESPQPRATLAFHITCGGRVDQSWRTDGFVLSDATGNEIGLPGEPPWVADPQTESWFPRGEAVGGKWVVSFLWPLWLDEPAYRLRVEFVRQPDAPFPPEDVLEVKAVPVPAADGISMINVGTNLHGFEVKPLALVGEHATLPGREHDVFGQTTLEVEVPPLPDGLRFDVVQVTDDQGQRAVPMAGAGSQSYGFRIPEGARMVDLKVAVSNRRVVEFLVKPTLRTAK